LIEVWIRPVGAADFEGIEESEESES